MTKSEELRQRYLALAHAMQTGVAFSMEFDPKQTEPKHLRVGINSSMSDLSGLAGLLMKKGIITEEEYMEALCESMEREVRMYKRSLREQYGSDVELR